LNPPSFSRHHCHFWPGSKLSCWKTIPCLSHCCLSWYGRHDATSCGEAEVIPSHSRLWFDWWMSYSNLETWVDEYTILLNSAKTIYGQLFILTWK
jgi:hypothetical protein